MWYPICNVYRQMIISPSPRYFIPHQTFVNFHVKSLILYQTLSHSFLIMCVIITILCKTVNFPYSHSLTFHFSQPLIEVESKPMLDLWPNYYIWRWNSILKIGHIIPKMCIIHPVKCIFLGLMHLGIKIVLQ